MQVYLLPLLVAEATEPACDTGVLTLGLERRALSVLHTRRAAPTPRPLVPLRPLASEGEGEGEGSSLLMDMSPGV